MINYIIIDDTHADIIERLFKHVIKNREIKLLGKFESYQQTNDEIEAIFAKNQVIDLAFIDWDIIGGEGTDFIDKLDKAYNNKTVKIIISAKIPINVAKEKESKNIKIYYIQRGDNEVVKNEISHILDAQFPINTKTFEFIGIHSKKIFETENVIYYSTLASFLFLFKTMLEGIKDNFVTINKINKSSAIELMCHCIENKLGQDERRKLSTFKVMILKNYTIYITNSNSESPTIEFFTNYSSKFELKQTITGGDYIINNEYFNFNDFEVLFFKTDGVVSLQFVGRNDSDITNLKIDNIRSTTPIE